jgi:hypothetical protein
MPPRNGSPLLLFVLVRSYFWRSLALKDLIKEEKHHPEAAPKVFRKGESHEERMRSDVEKYLQLEKDYGCR